TRFLARKKFNVLAQHFQEVMEESLPNMVDDRVKSSVIRPRDQDDPHDYAHLEGENSAKSQKTSEHKTYVFRESLSSQANESKPDPSTSAVQSFQRDHKAPAPSLVNQDLLYLKKGNSRPEKFVLSLHKFHVAVFLDDDIKERTSIWVDKCMMKFNPYTRYNVEH
nr:hypothetical protein [Tanacetum cinerariifolium]